ncbi:hypothetical protein [Luteimonas sp. TWI1416]|uniref:hypothetical protein n=1 Tax=unclassified Luteimonas TaxID=2629088 RepID=UPI0032088502
MSRTKKTAAPAAATTPTTASSTGHLFAGPRKPGDRGASVTSDRIAADLARFRAAGGRIEVLGVTRTLMRVDAEAPKVAASVPKKARGS